MARDRAREARRHDKEALERQVAAAGGRVRSRMVWCPFHADAVPSGSIYKASDGVWRFKCHTSTCAFDGGDIYDVEAFALGVKPGSLLGSAGKPVSSRSTPQAVTDTPAPKSPPPRRMGHPAYPPGPPPTSAATAPDDAGGFASLDGLRYAMKPDLEALYQYHQAEDGAGHRPVMIVLRLVKDGKKTFLQGHTTPEGRIVLKAPEKPWPIFRIPEIEDAPEVVVVEGEKCVMALESVGIAATTSPGGAGKAEHADWTPLAGKVVYLWPDNDETGVAHMRDVARILEALDPRPALRWLDCARLGLEAKGDAADVVERYGDLAGQTIMTVLRDYTEPMGPMADLRERYRDTLSGKYRIVPWCWESLTWATQALLPGTITVVCGDPGATKSFFVLQAAMAWHQGGVSFALYELEEDRRYHLARALAQLAANGGLTNDQWVREHPKEVQAALDLHGEALDAFGAQIWEAPDKQVTLEALAEWVEIRAKEGRRVIAVDPVTAAVPESQPWIADSKFLLAAKATVREAGASLVLVTHPKKGRGPGFGLDHIAGGAAYTRFSQTVVWIEWHEKPIIVGIRDNGESFNDVEINRTFHVMKARNGPGAGMQLGFQFRSDFTFWERGVIHEVDERSE